MDASLAFYRRLGVQIPEDAIWRTATGIHHVDMTMPSGLIVNFDSQRLAASYNDDPDGNHIGIMSAADPTRRGALPDL